MRYKAIIFDLDGVICFTDKFHYMAWKAMADRIGVYFDEVINNRLRGVSRMESLDIILERYNGTFTQTEKEALAQEKNELYKKYLTQMSAADLSHEVSDTLEKLRKLGLKLAIGSSSKNTQFILQQIGLGGYFDAVSDGNNITHSKPHPEVFLKAAQMLCLAPDQCLVVEDAKAGIEAAIAGGFESAGLGEASEHMRVTHRLSCFADLIDVI